MNLLPCPIWQEICKPDGKLLVDLCDTCPNRKPPDWEAVAREVEALMLTGVGYQGKTINLVIQGIADMIRRKAVK